MMQQHVWVAALVLMAGTELAQAGGIYLGAGGGLSRLTPDTDGSEFTLEEDSSTAIGVYAGYDITRRISVELAYTDLGEAGLSADQSISYEALSAGAAYYLIGTSDNLVSGNGMAAYLKLGIGSINNDADIDLETANNTAVWVAVGLELPLSQRLGIRGEIASFDGDAQALTISAFLRWGGSTEQSGIVTNQDSSSAGLPTIPEAAPVPVPVPTPAPEATAPASTAPQPAIECPAPVSGEPADERGCAIFTGILRGVEFDVASANLTPVGFALVDRLAQSLLQYPDIDVEIIAHTEAFDSVDTAQSISRQRAIAIARQLVGQGVTVNRLRARAFGSSQPRASNSTVGGRRLNNRVELRILP